MKHRASATRSTSFKLSFADGHPLQMAVESFSFPQYGSSVTMGGVLENGAMLQIFKRRFFFHDSSVVKKSLIFN